MLGKGRSEVEIAHLFHCLIGSYFPALGSNQYRLGRGFQCHCVLRYRCVLRFLLHSYLDGYLQTYQGSSN